MKLDNLPSLDPTKTIATTVRGRWRRYVLLAATILTVIGFGAVMYVIEALQPIDSQASSSVRFIVKPGQSAREIAAALHTAGLIRDPFVFQLFTSVSGSKSSLQAGGYILKKSYSVAQIVEHISSGKTDEVSVTILPGLTLEELADPEVKGSLRQQGFTADEIRAALATAYQSPVLTGRNPGDSLEGYIYPETYKLMASDTLDRVFNMSFSEFYNNIKTAQIEEKLRQQGLTLRQGIIMASIVQKEVSDPADQRQVAQVFLKRLKEGMVLGSDVTFLYIAKKEGRTPSVSDSSPYNTRKHGGLPPGPIANFNFSALEAVANPAPGDYLYFVAGDDGTTHFARTEAEHDANVAKYCTKLCN